MSERGGGPERTLTDPETHAEIIKSGTPRSEDGYFAEEPKYLSCPDCSAKVLLTRDPTDPGWDEMPHDSDCPQRAVKFRWWWRQFGGD